MMPEYLETAFACCSLILDFGCGNNKLRAKNGQVIGLDYRKSQEVDVVADFERSFILPFKSNVFDGAYLSHVLEHLKEPVILLEEVWRVCIDNAVVVIRVPHHSNPRAYEIHHKTYYSYFSLDPLTTKKGRSAEVQYLFDIVHRTFIMLPIKKILKPWQWLGSLVANRWPNIYEAFLHNFWPCYEILFEMRVRK